MAFTPNALLQLHGMLYRYMPNPGGRWKPADNDIVERRPDGTSRVRFKPTPAHLTPMAVEQLATHYAAAVQMPSLDSLIVVPLAMGSWSVMKTLGMLLAAWALASAVASLPRRWSAISVQPGTSSS